MFGRTEEKGSPKFPLGSYGISKGANSIKKNMWKNTFAAYLQSKCFDFFVSHMGMIIHILLIKTQKKQ